MTRDLDLIRSILLQIDQTSGVDGDGRRQEISWDPLQASGYELPAIHYHVELLHEAGLIRADELVPGCWWPERLTWEGHEFVDVARSDVLWDRVRRRVESSVGSAPFSLWQQLLLQAARDVLESVEVVGTKH